MNRLRQRAIVLALSLIVAGAADAVTIVKSPNDSRSYRHLELDNGLTVVLVHDPGAEKAAAALSVGVGSSANPPGREGLAHFLEHMLFLGTEKYPQADEYQAFISRHGGNHNAYTAFEETNFFFDIDADYLEPALDRFAQFFVAPLFNAEYVDRERHAVHSEYQMGLKDDARRIFSVLGQLANPEHPMSRFQVGSLETLADRPGHPVRDDLIAFYRRHYSADLMNLTVVGPQPLDTLEQWVRSRFAAVPRRAGAARVHIDAPLYRPEDLPREVTIEPVRDVRRLLLVFPVPPVVALYHTKPLDYLANLLGHEGEGSVLSWLKAQGWANALSAGKGLDNSDSATFSVDIELTAEGLAHREAIIERVFDYLSLLRRQGIERWRFAEQGTLAALRFRFQERQEPVSLARRIASELHRVPVADVLRAPYLMDRYEEGVIRDYLARLTPQRMIAAVVAKGLPTDTRDPWYDTPYAARPVPAARLAALAEPEHDPALRLPEPNPFVPEHLAVKPISDPEPHPVRIDARPGFELWHRQDPDFPEPRASLYFSLRSPAASDTPEHAVLSELYVRMVNEALNEYAYPARLAGLSYQIYRHVRGIGVRIHGFDDKATLLAQRILEVLRDPPLPAARFERVRRELVRELGNARRDRPYARAVHELRTLLVRPSWSIARRLPIAERVTREQLAAHVPELLRRLEVIALAHGNLLPGEARTYGELVYSRTVALGEPTAVPSARVVRLARGERLLRVLDDNEQRNAAVATYLQAPDKALDDRAVSELAGQVVSAPFYSELRTRRQLGYVVHGGTMNLLDVPGLLLLVQSASHDPVSIEANMADFLARFDRDLAALSAEDFEAHRQGVLTRLLKKEQRLRERSDRYWTELDLGYREFDSREQLAAAVRALSVDAFRRRARELIAPQRRAELTVEVPAAGDTAATSVATAGTRVIDDPDAFDRDRPFYVAGAGNTVAVSPLGVPTPARHATRPGTRR